MLPSRLTFSHVFSFPKDFSPKEIQKSLPLQAETIIPFAIDDVYWDFAVHESSNSEDPKQRIVFVAVSKEQADRYARVIQSLGVTPFLFGVEMDALSSAFDSNLTGNDVKLIVDLNSLVANYMLMRGKEILSYFSSNEGMDALFKDLSKGTKTSTVDYFSQWEELLKTPANQAKTKAFLTKRFKQADKILQKEIKDGEIVGIHSIILTGEFSILTGSLELAQSFFKDIQVIAGDPKQSLKVDESHFLKREDGFYNNKIYSVFFTHVIGIAKRALAYKQFSSVNILPTSLKSQVKDQKLSLAMSLFVSAMIVLNSLSAAYAIYLQQSLSYDRLNLEIQKESVEVKLFGTRFKEIQDALTLFNEEVSILTSIDVVLFSIPDTIDSVMALFPSGIEITQVSFEDASLTVDLEGVADTREALLELQNDLESSLLIEEALLPISNYDQKNDISFQMSLRLNFTQLPDYATSEFK